MKVLPQKNALKRDILLILAIKLVLIFALKHLFFNEPPGQHLNHEAVSQAFLGTRETDF